MEANAKPLFRKAGTGTAMPSEAAPALTPKAAEIPRPSNQPHRENHIMKTGVCAVAVLLLAAVASAERS